MDNVPTNITPGNNIFSNNKNTLIIVLIALLLLSLLGINLLTFLDNLVRAIYQLLSPVINQLFYTTGVVIDKSTEIVADTSKKGIDIAGGTLHDVGDLFKKAGEHNEAKLQLDKSINNSAIKREEPKPDNAENPIQKPIAAAKTNWCLVGEYQGRRGCIEIGEHDKCLSGQVFPNQKACLNPTLTNNMNNHNLSNKNNK
jgi:hypothetical protein